MNIKHPLVPPDGAMSYAVRNPRQPARDRR